MKQSKPLTKEEVSSIFTLRLLKAIEKINSYNKKHVSIKTPKNTFINHYTTNSLGIDLGQKFENKGMFAIYSDNDNETDFYDFDVSFLDENTKHYRVTISRIKIILTIELKDKTLIKITAIK